jgi:spermidine synthase
MRGRTVVMSNTPMEIRTNRAIIHNATGDVLINGLGIGMVLKAVLAKPDVRSVRVIEKHPEVIELVAPTYAPDPRVEIIQADCFDYEPPKGMRFNAVWHDIWDYICGDNLPEMHKLHRRYGRRADWQWSWCRERCEAGR